MIGVLGIAAVWLITWAIARMLTSDPNTIAGPRRQDGMGVPESGQAYTKRSIDVGFNYFIPIMLAVIIAFVIVIFLLGVDL